MLYEWELSRGDLEQILATSWAIQARPLDVDRDAMAARLVRATVERLPRIDALIAEASEHWRFERLSVVDRLILRLAVGELLEPDPAPGAVIIDQAVELAKTFSSPEGSRFVNGVLDGIRRRLEVGDAS
jgi:N utilization substance protein B